MNSEVAVLQGKLDAMEKAIYNLIKSESEKDDEVERLRARDFFCVYCRQVFSGSESADTLKAHVAVCPEHPLSKANAEVERLKGELAETQRKYDRLVLNCSDLLLTSRQEGINDVIEKVLFYTRTEWDEFESECFNLRKDHADVERELHGARANGTFRSQID
jgi:hypothetical protein